MTTITTRDDISTWIVNRNPHGYQDCPNQQTVHDALVRALQSGEHPAWGSDWSDYLDAFDFAALVDSVAEA